MRLFTLLLPLVLPGVSAAHAGAVVDCNPVRDSNRQLRGCTAYIHSRPDQPGNLATAFLNRANIYAADAVGEGVRRLQARARARSQQCAHSLQRR
jgi:hypothetical protein